MPIPIIEKSKAPAVPLHAVSAKSVTAWRKSQPAPVRNWLEANNFEAKPGSHCLLPKADGKLAGVACGVEAETDVWSLAPFATALPPHTYKLEGKFSPQVATQLALGWALASYEFTHYKKSKKEFPTLVAPAGCDMDYVRSMADAINWARDLINIPAGDMHPEALAAEALRFARDYKAITRVVQGKALEEEYPAVHAVGKAGAIAPRLVDIRAGRKGGKKVTLVGKGICFDSGGLDIKSASNMKLMKKDMAGVAIMMALARTILDSDIPVQLRLILPMAENAVAGNALHPLDIIRTRRGLSVEVGDTDAEGRLVICDALYEADLEKPDLLIDCTTLTGAARVALGLDMPAFFTPDDKLAGVMMKHSQAQSDPLWRLPLWKPYRKQLDSKTADISNISEGGYGGAITAALYLQEFVSNTASWLHLDMMAWNTAARPGRPVGGEAMAIRALHALIKERYAK